MTLASITLLVGGFILGICFSALVVVILFLSNIKGGVGLDDEDYMGNDFFDDNLDEVGHPRK